LPFKIVHDQTYRVTVYNTGISCVCIYVVDLLRTCYGETVVVDFGRVLLI